jgi:hypothetical protein
MGLVNLTGVPHSLFTIHYSMPPNAPARRGTMMRHKPNLSVGFTFKIHRPEFLP